MFIYNLFFFLRFGCKHEIDEDFCFILAIVDRRKVDKCGVQFGSCKTCTFITICALGILLILFCFWGFFLFIATVYIFADCNNELLVKKKYILLIIRTMYMYFFE